MWCGYLRFDDVLARFGLTLVWSILRRHDLKPGYDVIGEIYYSANFYTSTAVGTAHFNRNADFF